MSPDSIHIKYIPNFKIPKEEYKMFKRNVIANSFSLNMFSGDVKIPESKKCQGAWPGLGISIKEVPAASVPDDCYSVVGHADTARVISSILGWEVPANRVSYSVEKGDILYVAQYTGPRLVEGATELPDGATIKFYKIEGLFEDPASGAYASEF